MIRNAVSAALTRFALVPLALAALTVFAPLSGGGVAARQAVLPPAEVVRLTPAQATASAAEALKSVAAQVAEGLELTLWAPGQLVANPLAIDFDSRGVAFVTSSPRSGQLLDIREHPDWLPEIHTMKTVEDLRVFFRRVMAPERSAQNTWMPDTNKDGSHDWRDLQAFKERIYRLEDTNGDGIADLSRVVYEGFNEDIAADIAGGVLVHGDSLYVTAAPDLWKLSKPDKNGVYQSAESLSHGYSIHPAFSGHDMSALTIGPDGRIYWKIGDIGMNVVDRSGRRWVYPNRGAVLRADPDGSNFEVFATGLRNTQEIAFDNHGNLISADNDGDHPGETERLVYITLGSDAGWRSTWQFGKYTDPVNNRYNVWMDEGLFKPKFDGQAAYIVPPVAPYRAGPSGFAFNPGTALGDRWRDHFFVTSFPGNAAGARVYAFQLTEKGAGFDYKGDTQILRGVLTPGMKFGPDGALYLTDWITGWGASSRGRVWKLDDPVAAKRPIRAEVKTLLDASFAARPAPGLQALLGHADQRVRLKAQFELAGRRDVDSLLLVARKPGASLARLHAIWGLGQIARLDPRQAVTLTPFLADATPEVRAQAAKTIGDIRYAPATDRLMPLLADSAPRVRFFAAEALGRVGARAAVRPIAQMLAENDDRDEYLRHAGSAALANIADTTAILALADHRSPAVRLAAVVALRRLHESAVAAFLDDKDERVITEAARAINDEGSIPLAVPALAAVLDRQDLMTEPLVRRAINANVRVGTPEAVARVSAAAFRATMPAPLRLEAVSALGGWAAPSPFDRVDGSYHGPVQQRDPTAPRAAVAGLVSLLPQPDAAPALKIAVIEAVGRLAVQAAAPQVLDRLRGDASPQVRLAALRALQSLNTNADELIRVALADSDPQVRMAAIGMVASLPTSDAAKVQYLAGVLKGESIGEQQTALGLLGKVKAPETVPVLGGLLDQLEARTLSADVQLDVLDAARESGNEALLGRFDRLKLSRTLDNLATVFPEALQRGGVAMRGRQLAMQHPAAQCTRCHNLGTTEGATVGPPLPGIGTRLTREQLLQAMVDPSARIAPGFGVVSVTLRSGQELLGVLREETADALVIEAPTGNQKVAKADIAARTNAPSAMPPMHFILTPREIRDLVEFLATLK